MPHPAPLPPSTYNTPPPPPPKPSSRHSTLQSGPPLPPPRTHASSTTPHPPPPPSGPSNNTAPPPPGLDDGWLPPIVQDKPTNTLLPLLNSPAHLTALTLSPPHTHPSLPRTLPPIQHLLNQNLTLAHQLLTLTTRLTTQRAHTSAQLLHLHALERQWRAKQTQMDEALGAFAAPALHARLGAGIAEQEAYLAAVEESFLEGEMGRAGEREVGEVVRRWREGRRVLEVRRERRERWEEGRVGGWR